MIILEGKYIMLPYPNALPQCHFDCSPKGEMEKPCGWECANITPMPCPNVTSTVAKRQNREAVRAGTCEHYPDALPQCHFHCSPKGEMEKPRGRECAGFNSSLGFEITTLSVKPS